ncbi:hypothetical protein CEXT_103221 [Caerostris extrusa]|uniref:Uncharacterized protein n=1 Tax=Caerostris extrusa TaxID=172846 RepID=A0AAV4X4X3_CAEEX|nr:hypothetical protein CEXT_103221 [Caerostris extrusa]
MNWEGECGCRTLIRQSTDRGLGARTQSHQNLRCLGASEKQPVKRSEVIRKNMNSHVICSTFSTWRNKVT